MCLLFLVYERRLGKVLIDLITIVVSTELKGAAWQVRKLLCEHRLYLFHDFIRGRIPKTIRVNNLALINVNAELAESAFNRFRLYIFVFI